MNYVGVVVISGCMPGYRVQPDGFYQDVVAVNIDGWREVV
jgi:hypothetical protein